MASNRPGRPVRVNELLAEAGGGRAGSPITPSLRGGVGGGAVSGRLILGRRGGWLLESAGVCHPISGYLGVSTVSPHGEDPGGRPDPPLPCDTGFGAYVSVRLEK